ncbi:hypothetical protein KCMC57_up57260 [Kitasatospora sp. CMC57]|uniref:FMN-binding domain-containing protein n=1 Tax=Kitasatospora sp. CMC57 TaxID=3231513 RepID=A0AB33KD66_9ACTN
MRRAVVTSTATAAGVILLLSLKPHDSSPAAVISSHGDTDMSAGPTAETPSPRPSATAPGSPGSAAPARSVTGSAVDTRYGPVQVKVTFDGAKITAVDVIQYPTEDRRDREINSYALPVLNREAIAAQSAGVDVVSGATYTSNGYIRSLQSALDRAGR